MLKGSALFLVEPIGTQVQGFPLLTAGRETYMAGVSVHRSPEAPEVVNIHVGAFCSIATDVAFLAGVASGHRCVSSSPYLKSFESAAAALKGQIVIQNDVWIGHHVNILPGVVIGNGAVVAAGTVVSADVAPYAIVGGDPQRIIRYRFTPDQIAKLQNIAWWSWSYSELERNKHWFTKDIQTFTDHFCSQSESKPMQIGVQRQTRSWTILFFPDTLDPYAVWQDVIAEYRRCFTIADDVTLLLRIRQEDQLARVQTEVESMAVGGGPDIMICNDHLPDESALFSCVDYFITGRSRDTVLLTEYATRAAVPVLSGVDRPVFDWKLITLIRGHTTAV